MRRVTKREQVAEVITKLDAFPKVCMNTPTHAHTLDKPHRAHSDCMRGQTFCDVCLSCTCPLEVLARCNNCRCTHTGCITQNFFYSSCPASARNLSVVRLAQCMFESLLVCF